MHKSMMLWISLRLGSLFAPVPFWIDRRRNVIILGERVRKVVRARFLALECPEPGHRWVLHAIVTVNLLSLYNLRQRNLCLDGKPPLDLQSRSLPDFSTLSFNLRCVINKHERSVSIHSKPSKVTSQSTRFLCPRWASYRFWCSWLISRRPKIINESACGSKSIKSGRGARMSRQPGFVKGDSVGTDEAIPERKVALQVERG